MECVHNKQNYLFIRTSQFNPGLHNFKEKMTLISNADDFPEFAHLNFISSDLKCSLPNNSEEECEVQEDEFLNFSHDELSDCLLNKSGMVPLPARFRALFALKYLGDEKAIDIIGQGTL